ncbi:MAG: peptide deformylase [Rhizomicrobium sp.]
MIGKIARMGHPALWQPAAAITDPTADTIRRLAADMIETLTDAEGAGLAAPQVHVPVRMVIFAAPADRNDIQSSQDPNAHAPLTVLINPEITVLDDTREGLWEGCLSLPGLRGYVERPRRIGYRGLGLTGNVIEREATGFHARVVQHECDHLDGILYPQRMTDMKKFLYESELKLWPQGLPF